MDQKNRMNSKGYTTINSVCPHDCPDGCSILVTVDNKKGKAVRVEGDPSNPITRGYLCNKVNHYLDFVYSDKRVLYPHKRVGPKGPGAKFERITWDEALDTITDNFKSVIDEYGPEAIQPYSYSGTLGLINFFGMDQRFWNKMNAARLDQSICAFAGIFAHIHTYGCADGPSTETLPDAKLIILWANNVVSTGVHMVPFLEEARKNGAKIIVIDPRKTRTAMFADVHLQPKPGTDAALALGMMKIIVDKGMHDEEFLKEQTFGWEELLRDELPKWPLDKVSKITGLSKADIEQFAMDYASTKKSCIRGNWGLQRHRNSGQTSRSILILPCITGAWREKCGGVLFWSGEENWMRLPTATLQRPDLGERGEKRSINMVQIGRALTDNVDSNGDRLTPPIKSLYVYNSDVANCAPNTNNVRKGLMRDDLFVAVHDVVWTDSCDYADIVIPADSQLERSDLHAPWGHYIYSLSKPCIQPLGESVRNTEVFRMLAKKMGYTEETFEQSDEDMIKELITPEGNPGMEGITYEGLEKTGWARCAVDSPNRDWTKIGWPTESGKVNIWSKDLEAQGQPALPTYVAEEEGQEDLEGRKKYPLQVVSAATHYFIGSSFQHVERLHAMMSRPTVELNPADAKARGIEDGQLCRLYNDRGETYAYAVVIDGLLPGMCGTQKQFKGSNTPGGVNANALISEDLTDFGGSPVFYSCLVEIEKASEADMANMEQAISAGEKKQSA